jgi:hypothetical protein
MRKQMTKMMRRLKRRTKSTRNRFEDQTAVDDQIKSKRSLGALRKNEKTKPRSPDVTGKLCFQRHTLLEIYRQFRQSGDDEVVCNIAGWNNDDHQGSYLTVEVSPEFVPRNRRTPKRGLFNDVFNEQDE